MTTEPIHSPGRREVLGAIGVAGAGVAAMATGAMPVAAQSSAPLKIVDFHNHHIVGGLKTNGVADTKLMEDATALVASVGEAARACSR